MSSKLDSLKRGVGENVNESMGVGRPQVSGLPLAPVLPAKVQGIKKLTDAALIPVDRIQPDPDQPREEFDEEPIERLAIALKTQGQLQPIRVRWNDQLETYIIVCGERRWRAAVKAGLEMMQCVIQTGALSQSEILALQCMENLLREDLKPIEQAKAFRSLRDINGWSTRELARQLSIGHAGVVKALALLDLPDELQDQVEQGTLKPSVAYAASMAGDAESIMAVATEAAEKNLSRDETVELAKRTASKSAKSSGKGGGLPRPAPRSPARSG